MAAVPVTLRGVVTQGMGPAGPYDVGQEITFVGLLNITGLGVGGGPVIPPAQPPVSGPPGVPIHPIWGPPGFNPPGPGMPPGIGGGPIIPPSLTPPDPPTDPSVGKPPPPGGGWGWHPEYGWGYFPGGGGKPQPQP